MLPSSPPKAVAFDLDGLMFNTEDLYLEVGTELLHRRGKTLEQSLVDEMMGLPSRLALGVMIDRHGLSDTVAQLQTETDDIFDRILGERLAPMPGLVDLIDALDEAGIPKAVATSSRRSFAARVLSMFDFERRFTFILAEGDVVRGKPHPEIYLEAARRFGVSPFELLVLEDSQNGCRAAAAAGTFAVAVPCVHCRHHDFSGASLVVDSLRDKRLYAALGLERP